MSMEKIGKGALTNFLHRGLAEIQAVSYFQESNIAQQAQSMLGSSSPEREKDPPEIEPTREAVAELKHDLGHGR